MAVPPALSPLDLPSETELETSIHQAAEQAQTEAVALIVYHQTGAAVIDQVNRASRQAPTIRERFEPRFGVLSRAFWNLLRFFTAKISFKHLFVLDAVIPPGAGRHGLDQLVRQLGFQVDDNRQVGGSLARIFWRFVAIFFTLILVPAIRYTPDVLSNPFVKDTGLTEWLSRHVMANLGFLILVGLSAALALLVWLEVQANLLGLLYNKAELNNSDEEVGFIVEEVRKRQARSFLALLVELHLVYLLVIIPVLPVLHLVFLSGRLLRWLRTSPRPGLLPGRLLGNLTWLLLDLLIPLCFLAGAGWLGSFNPLALSAEAQLPERVWGGVFLSSVAFLAINTGREVWKLRPRPADRDDLSLLARSRRGELTWACAAIGVLLLAAFWLWFIPETSPVRAILGPATLLPLTTLALAQVRTRTQSLKSVLLRICEVQRLGDDFPNLYAGLRDVIPDHLLVIGLWNVDEAPETPTSYRSVHAALDSPEDLHRRFQRIFPRHFIIPNREETLPRLAEYVCRVARGLHEPYQWFVSRIQGRGLRRANLFRLFCLALPTLVDQRLQAHDALGSHPADEQASWKEGFERLHHRLLAAWSVGELKPFPAPTLSLEELLTAQDGSRPGAELELTHLERTTLELIDRLVELIREWEADTLRFHLDILVRRKQHVLPDYAGHLVRLALFLDLNVEHYLVLEQTRREHAPNGFGQHSRGVPLSLCRQAGLFYGLTHPQARRFTADYRRENLLESADPVIFQPARRSFLATVFLPTPLLYSEHDKLLVQLVQAGRDDHRFLKVAAGFARRIQQADYQRQLPSSGLLHGTRRKVEVISGPAALDLLLRSTVLLLDYYERLAEEGLPGLTADELDGELTALAQDDGVGLSITSQLAEAARRIAQLRAGGVGMERQERVLADLGERWRRLQIRRYLLIGAFDLQDDASPARRTPLGRLLQDGPACPILPATADGCYDARCSHNHYFLGLIALECSQPLAALSHFAAAAAASYLPDDALHVRSVYLAARSLAAMNLHGWAASLLERLLARYSIYLGDDPLVLQVMLALAQAEAFQRPHSSLPSWAVQTRWLAPVQQRAAQAGLPPALHAQLEQIQALYEEKRGEAQKALATLRAAHAHLLQTPTRPWQVLLVQVDLARLASRNGLSQDASLLLSSDCLQRLHRQSRLGYLEACHTLARDSQAVGHYGLAATRFLTLLEAAVAPESHFRSPGQPGQLSEESDQPPAEELSSVEVVERVRALFGPLQAQVGVYIPWNKALQAVYDLSDLFRIRATAHQVGQLLSPERRRTLQESWVSAYRLVAETYKTFRNYLRQASTINLLSGKSAEALTASAVEEASGTQPPSPLLFFDPPARTRSDQASLPLLDAHFALPTPAADREGRLRLADVYFDRVGLEALPGSDGRQEYRMLTPPLRQLIYQLYHVQEGIHLGLSLFLPPADGGAVPEQSQGAQAALAADSEPFVTDAQGRLTVRCRVNVGAYRSFLKQFALCCQPGESPGHPTLRGVNSATLRHLCEFCRLYLLQQLFRGRTPGMSAEFEAWAQRKLRREEGQEGPGIFDDPDLPADAYLLLLWERVSSLDRLRVWLRGLIDRLATRPRGLAGVAPYLAEAEADLHALLQRLNANHDDSPTHVEALTHRLHRLLTDLSGHGPEGPDGRPDPKAENTLRFLLLPGDAHEDAAGLMPYYEEALTVLLSHAENDLIESILNRVALLEGLRDASLFFSERKRELFLGRVIQAWGEQLFLDLDRQNNPHLTNYVKRCFFPHWDDIRQSLREIQSLLRHLQASIKAGQG